MTPPTHRQARLARFRRVLVSCHRSWPAPFDELLTTQSCGHLLPAVMGAAPQTRPGNPSTARHPHMCDGRLGQVMHLPVGLDRRCGVKLLAPGALWRGPGTHGGQHLGIRVLVGTPRSPPPSPGPPPSIRSGWPGSRRHRSPRCHPERRRVPMAEGRHSTNAPTVLSVTLGVGRARIATPVRTPGGVHVAPAIRVPQRGPTSAPGSAATRSLPGRVELRCCGRASRTLTVGSLRESHDGRRNLPVSAAPRVLNGTVAWCGRRPGLVWLPRVDRGNVRWTAAK